MAITYRLMTTAHPLYPKCVRLRRNRFWEPMRIMTSVHFDKEERESLIFGALNGTRTLVGCVLLTPEPENDWIRLRQLVVDENYTHKGIATQLVQLAMETAYFQDYRKIALYAFEGITEFFEKFGFQIQSGWYTHANGMRSVLMIKEYPKR
ncbi:MAG: GNAT family N-acetyltransferase [Alphaproteobacteria bacterium]|nr:GNAT family N-acetyltransferase [Alphaproteobacteria bacterium]